MTEDPASAAHRRRQWPVRIYRLGEEPPDDLSRLTTPAERVAMVWELSARMWELTGQPSPGYSRATMPGRVIRPA
ncbi:MAG: hypothetical protein M3Q93_09000 [Gemmatimonadota bacterium]|nr:hypothetical protein [Gemmatimonadota bacterium]